MSTRRFVVKSGEDLGRMIAEARTVRGLTQADLAVSSGVERTYISRLETGLTTLQLERALVLLRRLGVTLHGSMETDSDG